MVSLALPGFDLGDQAAAFADAPIEALAAQHADFDFDHVEPTGVLWRVVEFEPAEQAMGFRCRECFV